jgi:hypothetical protein
VTTFITPRPTEAHRPVVERADSVTHFTCPKAPTEERGRGTHHLAGTENRCIHCKAGAGELRERYGL